MNKNQDEIIDELKFKLSLAESSLFFWKHFSLIVTPVSVGLAVLFGTMLLLGY